MELSIQDYKYNLPLVLFCLLSIMTWPGNEPHLSEVWKCSITEQIIPSSPDKIDPPIADSLDAILDKFFLVDNQAYYSAMIRPLSSALSFA